MASMANLSRTYLCIDIGSTSGKCSLWENTDRQWKCIAFLSSHVWSMSSDGTTDATAVVTELRNVLFVGACGSKGAIGTCRSETIIPMPSKKGTSNDNKRTLKQCFLLCETPKDIWQWFSKWSGKTGDRQLK